MARRQSKILGDEIRLSGLLRSNICMEIGLEKYLMFIDGHMTILNQDLKRTLFLKIFLLRKEKKSSSINFILNNSDITINVYLI